MPCSQRNSESLASAPYKPAHLLRRPDKRASPHISSLRAQASPSHLALCARTNARNGALRFKPIHLPQRAHLPRHHNRPELYPIKGQQRRRPLLRSNHLPSSLRQHPAPPAPVASAKGPSTPTIACTVTFVQAIWPLWVVAVAKAALGLKHHQFGTSVLAPPAPWALHDDHGTPNTLLLFFASNAHTTALILVRLTARHL